MTYLVHFVGLKSNVNFDYQCFYEKQKPLNVSSRNLLAFRNDIQHRKGKFEKGKVTIRVDVAGFVVEPNIKM